MRKERCASAAFATVYKISHRFIMSVESSKNKKKSTSQKSIALFSSNKSITKWKSLTSTHILKRSFTFITSQFSQNREFIEQLKQHDATLTSINSKSTFSLKSVYFSLKSFSFSSMNIAMIETATYKRLVKWSDIKIFAVIILKINRLITTVENKSEKVNLHELSHAEALKQVKIKLFSEYHDYLNIFDRAMINQLSLHHFYNHKIELINEEMFSRSRLYQSYQMFNHKLQKIKKYLINHLNKEFIFFNFASYISLILFIKKKDDSLRFCIDYRKLNALIKQDHYSLSLIDETFIHIQESKYLTRLNIIVTFNKLCMHSNSEDLTIFIIFFNSYKYHVMLFELINEFAFYQHYMNDVLFEYLHQFCQIYLNDIIIYSKILKKHKQHVQLILNRLREADLQIDINKCEFHVQKTIFLELLISIKELKMNSRKMQAVVDWSTFNNLTQMQFFIDFCNFYQHFIKNFSKIVHSMIQLTQKKIIFEWNEVCQIIFDHIKRRMIKTSILRYFD